MARSVGDVKGSTAGMGVNLVARIGLARWLAVVFVLSAALGACSPSDQGAVTLDSEARLPRAVVALCDGEVVERVTLLSVEDDRRSPIWQIDGRATGNVFAVTVGDVPEGFVETIPRVITTAPQAPHGVAQPVLEGSLS